MSLVYIDTSIWVSSATEEPLGARAADQLEALSHLSLCLSDWVITEFASALSLKRRRKELSDSDIERCHRMFERTTKALTSLPIEPADYIKASALCRDFTSNLRASDALHLAIAIRHKCKMMFSLDDVLNSQAVRHGLRIVDL